MSSQSSVLITGAGSGIGLATAKRFLREGWRVVAVGRRQALLQDLERFGQGNVLPIACDIAEEDSPRRIVAALTSKKEFGDSIKVLVNNAGLVERRSFKDSSDELWSRTFAVNLFAPVRLTHALLDRLEKNKGAVINVASNLGLRPIVDTSAYSASKAAMVNWTQSLALELGPKGVRANCICPGIVDTPIQSFHKDSEEQKKALGRLQPIGRIGTPDDVAHAIWSVSGPGSEWMTGSVLTVDGGISLV